MDLYLITVLTKVIAIVFVFENFIVFVIAFKYYAMYLDPSLLPTHTKLMLCIITVDFPHILRLTAQMTAKKLIVNFVITTIVVLLMIQYTYAFDLWAGLLTLPDIYLSLKSKYVGTLFA